MQDVVKILIVDDNEVDRLIYKEHIHNFPHQKNYEITTADTAEMALNLLATAQFDCVLIDYHLPDYTGLEFIDMIKQNFNAYPPIIMLTGQGNEDVASQALKLGVSDYIIKSRLTQEALHRAITNSVIKRYLEDQLREKNASLSLANTSLQKMNDDLHKLHHVLSHELKTPLTALYEFINILLDGIMGELSKEQKEILKNVLECCDQLKMYINDLTDLMLLESDKMILEKADFLIEELINHSIKLTHTNAESRHIQMSTEFNKSIHTIHADEKRILQVIINILNNAIKFSPENSTIHIKVSSTTDNYVTIAISDAGCGIPKEHLSKIFNAYYQVENEAKRKGLGLGLNICKLIIDKHQGRLEVESEINQGTTFKIILPQF
ncbi:MAG: hybrid sensor histidine kinase/response regulator [Legionellales bacterium]|nr:hybrid sensor histidine kinase/response regulator [Legionellales bacterium]